MDEINEDTLKELLNKIVKIESRNRVLLGELVDVGNHEIKLKLLSTLKRNQMISISIEDIDGIMYKAPGKNVGY